MSGVLMLNNKNYTATGNLRLGGIIVGTVPILVSNGVQRLTLPVYGDEDIKINTTIYPMGNSGDTNIIGNQFTESGWVLHFAGRNTLNFRYSSGNPVAFASEPFTLREIEMATADGSLIVDGTTITSGHSTSYNHYPIQLFGINEGGTNYSYVGIGEMKIYKNDTLFMHLIPRKDSNDHGYFYDEIGEQSYYSDTSDHLFFTEIKAN
jgi:hypothetical protein